MCKHGSGDSVNMAMFTVNSDDECVNMITRNVNMATMTVNIMCKRSNGVNNMTPTVNRSLQTHMVAP